MNLSILKRTITFIATITLAIAADEPKRNTLDLESEKSVKRYVGVEKFKDFDTIKAFKFISFRGDHSSWKTDDGTIVNTEKDNGFQSGSDALVFIREKLATELGDGTIVGNAGVGSCLVVPGKSAISFIEILGSGCAHQFTVTSVWNPKLGGFNATYHRRYVLTFGGKSVTGNTTYYGVAVPWE